MDNKKISIGVKKTETIVEKKVHTIDRATFPLHKYVIKFEAVPPGQQPNIITPRESSGGILKIFTNTEMNGLEESTGMTFSAGETKHGSFATEKIQILFGDDSIKSVVISVFKNKNKIGLLLIGSKDKTRYLGDEDTTFIEFIRDIAEAKLKTFPA